MQITGNQVRGFREERNLSQGKLGKMLGVTLLTIANWERCGNRCIPLNGIDRFRGWYKAKKMGVPYNPPPSRPGKPKAYDKPEIALEDVLDAAE
jgi:transcriptional regulator with XRE-family HTH domain